MLLAATTGAADAASTALGLVLFLGFIAVAIGAGVWFFRGPAKAVDNYVNGLALQLSSQNDAVLFRQIYVTKGPKSTTVAWLLTAILSPTISYLYRGKFALAAISFLTLQGFGIWWLIALFTTPTEVFAMNKRLADEAYQQVALRGTAAAPMQQIVNVHQYVGHPPLSPMEPALYPSMAAPPAATIDLGTAQPIPGTSVRTSSAASGVPVSI